MLLHAVENFKAGSERLEDAGRSLSPPPGSNWDPTPSAASSPTHPVSDWMHFRNRALRTSGEAEVAGSGFGRSLEPSHRNRPLEKADEDGRGDLGG